MARIDDADWRVGILLEAIGVPYVWGAGDLQNARWVADGYDCSGFAQAALLELGMVDSGAWVDKTAHDLANACDPIDVDDAGPGDLCFYGSGGKITHVTVALGGGMCIGANGGGSKTNGDDPNACVQVRPIGYSSRFVTCGRLKEEYRPHD